MSSEKSKYTEKACMQNRTSSENNKINNDNNTIKRTGANIDNDNSALIPTETERHTIRGTTARWKHHNDTSILYRSSGPFADTIGVGRMDRYAKEFRAMTSNDNSEGNKMREATRAATRGRHSPKDLLASSI